MATDRSLVTLLRALQDDSNEEQDISRLLGSATTLLTLLINPLNVTLLTAQLLSASAIWGRPEGLRTTIRVLSIFNSASLQVLKNEASWSVSNAFAPHVRLAKEDWIIAVIRGVDGRSPRWRHMLALGGLLIGFQGREHKGISKTLQTKVGAATVKALNLALEETEFAPEVAVNSMVMVLSHIFSLLGDHEKHEINYDLLLPRLSRAPLFSNEGLHRGYFLSTMDADIVEVPNKKFDWSTKSSTYFQIQRMASSPLVASLGSLSRIIAYSIDFVQNVDILSALIGDISAFARSLCIQWRQNKLSEIDMYEESTYLSEETLRASLPLLWRVLKSSMFSIVVILRSLFGRLLGDPEMSTEAAPYMAIQALHTLRNLYFITTRMGANSFSQYTFVYLTAMDILSQYPIQAEAFLREIRPAIKDHVQEHPLDRCLDLYYLNTAENFSLSLTPQANEELLMPAATPYLGIASDDRLMDIFEAAHSVMLAVLSAPQNSEIVSKHLHSYVDTLFNVFPRNLTSRQFRIAVKTLVRLTSPPSLISVTQPLLSSTLLEFVHMRLEGASPVPLQHPKVALGSEGSRGEDDTLSEQSVLVLTLIDSLPFLPIALLEEWLPITAASIGVIQDLATREKCQQIFWDVFSNGAMDVDRAALCVSWWNTRGGREMVLQDHKNEEVPLMSGGLGTSSKL